jgi:hypothetical protein
VTRPWLAFLPVAILVGAGPVGAQAPEEQRPPRGFSETAHVDESWESDPIFESRDEPSSFVTRMGAGLIYQGGGRRGTLSIAGEGGGVFHHNIAGYNTYYYGGTLSWAQRLSTRTNFTLTENVTDDYARRSNLLLEGGLVFSLVRAFTSRTDARLIHELSPRTRLETYAGYDYVKFLSGDLLDGRQLRAGLSLSRKLRARSTLGLAYGFTRSTKDLQPDQDVHSGRVVWSRAFGRNNSMGASIGATALRRLLDRTWSVNPTGNANVSIADPRTHLIMTLRYEHEVNQAFGLGVERVADLLAFSLSRPIGRKLSCAAGYGYSLSRDTGEDVTPFRFRTHNANGNVRYAATRTFAVDLGDSFFYTGYYTPAVNNHVLQLGLAYRRDPR